MILAFKQQKISINFNAIRTDANQHKKIVLKQTITGLYKFLKFYL